MTWPRALLVLLAGAAIGTLSGIVGANLERLIFRSPK